MMNANVGRDKGYRLPADILGTMLIKLFQPKISTWQICLAIQLPQADLPAIWTIQWCETGIIPEATYAEEEASCHGIFGWRRIAISEQAESKVMQVSGMNMRWTSASARTFDSGLPILWMMLKS